MDAQAYLRFTKHISLSTCFLAGHKSLIIALLCLISIDIGNILRLTIVIMGLGGIRF